MQIYSAVLRRHSPSFLWKQHQSLAKPEKNTFLDWPKQAKLAKHMHGKLKGVNLTAETMQTDLHDQYTAQSNGFALLETLP